MLRTILFLGFFLPSSLAFSITMTFDSIWESLAPNTPGRYTENGITASDSSPICNHCPSIYGWLGGPMGDPSMLVIRILQVLALLLEILSMQFLWIFPGIAQATSITN